MVARRAGLKRRHPTSTATITARSRNLGISWSNEPERIWNADCSSSWLSIRTPEPPKACNLGIAGVLREAADIARKHSGNEYSLALWVGGKRVANPSDVLRELRWGDEAVVVNLIDE